MAAAKTQNPVNLVSCVPIETSVYCEIRRHIIPNESTAIPGILSGVARRPDRINGVVLIACHADSPRRDRHGVEHGGCRSAAQREGQGRTGTVPAERAVAIAGPSSYTVASLLHFTAGFELIHDTETHGLTDACWKKCIASVKNSNLDRSEETCLANCTNRFLDVQLMTMRQIASLGGRTA
jgi:hypothetical protein